MTKVKILGKSRISEILLIRLFLRSATKFWEAGSIDYNPVFRAALCSFLKSVKCTDTRFTAGGFYALDVLALAGWLEQLEKLSSVYSCLIGMNRRRIVLTVIWIPMTDI